MNSLERFQRRKQLKRDLNIVARDTIADSGMIINKDHVPDNTTIFDSFDFSVSDSEVQQLLGEIKAEYDRKRFEELLSSCKQSVISSIVAPFGLGKIVAQWDKEGGNVTTIHNARKGVYALDEEKSAYENRGEYNSSEYHSHKGYIEKNRINTELKEQGRLVDEYTGKTFERNAKVDLDHAKSAKEIHDDPGRVLAGLNGPDLANTDSNLNATSMSVNRSMGQKSIDEYHTWLQETAPQRQQRIQELSSKNTLSDKERIELSKLQDLENFNYELAHEKDKLARKEYEKKVNEYYTSGKFLKNTAVASVKEGSKMGFRQALGVAFCEFFYGVLDEAKDAYANGFNCDNASFFESLKIRFMRVAKRVKEKWKDVLAAFGEGFISGFFSNIVTIIINMFVKTGKNVVRIIREGFFSLLKAIKMLFCPPEGMTFRQAAHEATKIIAAGLTIAGGILLEEYVDKLIKLAPMLEFMSDILTSVIIGTVTGLATAFIVYTIDKMDLLGVNKEAEFNDTIKRLTQSMDSSVAVAESICQALVF